MNAYELNGKNYPVNGTVWSQKFQCNIPLVDIPMMSDERWQELARLHPVSEAGRAMLAEAAV